MKKFFWTLSLIVFMGLVGCGDKEAKELLLKILNLIGIPQSIVVNICQDGNKNGICEVSELQAKVTMNHGDDMNDIFKKLTDNKDGSYFLETYNPELPILLVLKDSDAVHYDAGQFTLTFNGFRTNEHNETKELSILESMIDADHLTTQNVVSIRNLTNPYAQEQFYTILLRDLESNINTLRAVGLTAVPSMRGNIKEMAEELLAFGVEDALPKKLNACNSDSACIDEILNSLSIELLITNAEAEEIKKSQEAIATTDDSNQNKIDMAKYFPDSSMTKEYITSTAIDGQELQTSSHSEVFTVKDNVITQKNSNGVTQTTTVKEDTIVSAQADDELITYSRYSQAGDVLYTVPLDSTINDQSGGTSVTTGEMVCTLAETMNEFSNKDYIYTGDILKISCVVDSKTELTSSINSDFLSTTTTKGTIIQYLQEGIGLVAYIGDSCSEGNFVPKICTHTEINYLK